MNDLGKKDILRFGVVDLSRILLSGSLESLREACIEICCGCGLEEGRSRGQELCFYIDRRVSVGCWNLPEIVPSEDSGMIVRSEYW
jgi:hypothetical protein